jgi:FtsP/CotA-like multicopper oxidase with cupredoxin domain
MLSNGQGLSNTRKSFRMTISRRTLLTSATVAAALPRLTRAAGAPPDYTLRIASGLVELAPEHIVSTTLYNGAFPGPLLRLKEGQRTTIDIHNDTDSPELVHWHGLNIPSAVDGSAEEGSPFIPAHRMQRVSFVPKPAGLRFYHSHAPAGSNLSRGTYSGQAGAIYIEPENNPGAFDQEIFLVMKEFSPAFSHGGDSDVDMMAGEPLPALKAMGEAAQEAAPVKTQGFELNYGLFSINGHMLATGEPLRVRYGERVLFHVVNASATENRSLAMAGHEFQVLALDGNKVPNPATVPVLWLGTGERISAVVEMRKPGIWTLGDLDDHARRRGMGIVVEYAGQTGDRVWAAPQPFRWDYTAFAKPDAVAAKPDETLEFTILKHNGAMGGFNQWTLNGEAFSMQVMKPLLTLHKGRRYRLKFRNATDDTHPLHLHRHSFELTHANGKPTAGVIKDVAMLAGYHELAFDFTADNPGPTLFHCHMQAHMDYGFAALFDYA